MRSMPGGAFSRGVGERGGFAGGPASGVFDAARSDARARQPQTGTDGVRGVERGEV